MAKSPASHASSVSEAGGDATTVESELQNENRMTKTVTPELFNPNDLGPEMPEVRQHAIDAAREKQANNAPKGEWSHVKDKLGNPFDPAIHESDDGVPRTNADGVVRRKRGAGGTAKNASKLEAGPRQAPQPDQAAQDNEAQIKGTAMALTGLTFALGQMIGGPEFAPMVLRDKGIDEPAEFNAAYVNVCQAYNITDIPPWAALALVSIGYAGKRWNAPQFTKKRQSWWDKCKTWFRRKEIRAEKKKEAATLHKEVGVNRPVPDVSNMPETEKTSDPDGSFATA